LHKPVTQQQQKPQSRDLHLKLLPFQCTKETCSFYSSRHAGVREYGKFFDAAAIPDALAAFIARNVEATLVSTKNLDLEEQATVTPDEEKTFNDVMAGAF
jgi:hypothetical protein